MLSRKHSAVIIGYRMNLGWSKLAFNDLDVKTAIAKIYTLNSAISNVQDSVPRYSKVRIL